MIYVPQALWLQMYDLLAETPGDVERVVYLDGVWFKTGGVVTTLTIPHADLAAGGYEVSSDAMSQAGKHLRQLCMTRLAQAHTHPGEWVGHSPKDGEASYSQMSGAVSIVIPQHGIAHPPLCQTGVHLRNRQTWRQLCIEEIGDHIQILPSVLDFRTEKFVATTKDITWNEYLIATKALLAGFLRRFLNRERFRSLLR